MFSFQDKKYLILAVKSMEGECWPTLNQQILLIFFNKVDWCILMFIGCKGNLQCNLPLSVQASVELARIHVTANSTSVRLQRTFFAHCNKLLIIIIIGMLVVVTRRSQVDYRS